MAGKNFIFRRGPYPEKGSAEGNSLIIGSVNMDRYKHIEAISMGSEESLVISFHGFENSDAVHEFAKYVFAKIKMSYHSLEKPPTIH